MKLKSLGMLASSCMFGFMLMGCASNRLVTIHYDQLGNCGNTVGVFAFYRITKIENDDQQAVDFHFAVNKLAVVGHTWELQVYDPRFTAIDSFVPAHTTLSRVPRAGMVMLSVRDVSPNEYGAFLDLAYASSGSESVMMLRDGGSNPSPPLVIDPFSCNSSTFSVGRNPN